jgi:anthranilate synthase component 1
VRQAKEYIAAGDIFQVVLSQRLSGRTNAHPFTIYRALRRLNPSPYMVFMRFPGGWAPPCMSSPPALRCTSGSKTASPGAAHRRHSAARALPAEDAAHEADLLADPKERAEHVMLVDLGRNDLGTCV